jgi:hypothetical protein
MYILWREIIFCNVSSFWDIKPYKSELNLCVKFEISKEYQQYTHIVGTLIFDFTMHRENSNIKTA